MDMTGWVQGQVFVQTVDEQEVAQVTRFLESHGLTFQVLTLSERMVVSDAEPDGAVSTDRFSIAIQVAGFPQVIGPLLSDFVQRVHGAGWDDAEGPAR